MLAKSNISSLFLPVLMLSGSVSASEIQVERQKELLYMLQHDCGSCHGISLKGGLGPSLSRENLISKQSRLLEYVISDGRKETAMPAWRGILDAAEIAWLVARLREGIQELQ